MKQAVTFLTLVALAQMWNLLAGYAGLVSVGQQAFVGIGGYSLWVFSQKFGLNPFLCVPIAGVVAALFAVPTAGLAFRLRGGYFAVGTWVIAEVYRLLRRADPLAGRRLGRQSQQSRQRRQDRPRTRRVLACPDRGRGVHRPGLLPAALAAGVLRSPPSETTRRVHGASA